MLQLSHAAASHLRCLGRSSSAHEVVWSALTTHGASAAAAAAGSQHSRLFAAARGGSSGGDSEGSDAAAAGTQQQQQAAASDAAPGASPPPGAPPQLLISPGLLAQASGTLNRLTGYSGIDALKAQLADVDAALHAAKAELRAAKADYDARLAQQSAVHREVTDLLQRKNSWVAADLSRFTELYAAEHTSEQAVAAAKGRFGALTEQVDGLQRRLVDLIRERYQQEQLWSDKIRRASTWWTWGLMGLHFASFVAVYTILEPRKRQAMTDAVAGMMAQHAASLDARLTQLLGGGGGRGVAAAAAAGAAGDAQLGRQQPLDAAGELQQRVLTELQAVQQQLQALQQQLNPRPRGAASASGGAASEAAAAASPRQWRIPGAGWVSQQAGAAGQLAQRSWATAWDRGRDVARHSGALQGLTGQQQHEPAGIDSAGQQEQHQQQRPQRQVDLEQRPAGHAESPQGSAEAQQQQQQPPAGSRPQQPGTTPADAGVQQAAGGGGRSGAGGVGLLEQLRGGGSILQVTRGQLAGVGAAASAAGAGLAVVVVLLAGSRGGAGGC